MAHGRAADPASAATTSHPHPFGQRRRRLLLEKVVPRPLTGLGAAGRTEGEHAGRFVLGLQGRTARELDRVPVEQREGRRRRFTIQRASRPLDTAALSLSAGAAPVAVSAARATGDACSATGADGGGTVDPASRGRRAERKAAPPPTATATRADTATHLAKPLARVPDATAVAPEPEAAPPESPVVTWRVVKRAAPTTIPEPTRAAILARFRSRSSVEGPVTERLASMSALRSILRFMALPYARTV